MIKALAPRQDVRKTAKQFGEICRSRNRIASSNPAGRSLSIPKVIACEPGAINELSCGQTDPL